MLTFGNHSGIGYQTRRLCELLKPDRILYIDSTSFSKNKKQNYDWYSNFTGYKTKGFPTDQEISVFLSGEKGKDPLTHVFCVENPLNFSLLSLARKMGIKVFIQSNYEFCDHLDKNIELPHKFLMPSHWKVEEMKKKFGDDKVIYLPPPIDPNEFKEAREINLNRKGKRRFLHIVGTLAVHDRNGTLDLLAAIEQTNENFELVIKSQQQLPQEYTSNHPKIKYESGSVEESVNLYKDFDALILPRRYGGLSLPMHEGLMSALPCIMTDISPNNQILPKKWLVPAEKVGEFQARIMIDVYQSDINKLAEKIDSFTYSLDYDNDKLEAFDLGMENFSFSKLKPQYSELWK